MRLDIQTNIFVSIPSTDWSGHEWIILNGHYQNKTIVIITYTAGIIKALDKSNHILHVIDLKINYVLILVFSNRGKGQWTKYSYSPISSVWKSTTVGKYRTKRKSWRFFYPSLNSKPLKILKKRYCFSNSFNFPIKKINFPNLYR